METKRELKVFYSSLTVHTDGGVKTLEASKTVRLTFKQEHDKVILTYIKIEVCIEKIMLSLKVILKHWHEPRKTHVGVRKIFLAFKNVYLIVY